MYDITLVPSICETFCQVAAESVASGTPVVAFKTFGIVDTVPHDIVGFLSDSFTSEGLANALQSVSRNIYKSQSYYVPQCKSVSRLWDYDVVAHKYYQLYRTIMNT